MRSKKKKGRKLYMAVHEIQMRFTEFWTGLVIPFTYNQNAFSLLGEKGQERLLPECRGIEQNENVFNDYGKKTFEKTDRGEPVAKGFEIADDGSWRTDIGLSRNPDENYIFYFWEAGTCKIRFNKFKLYFFKTGNGFLIIETTVEDIDYKHILDLKYNLTYIPGKNATQSNKISYTQAGGNTEQEECCFTIQELAGKCFAWFHTEKNNDCFEMDIRIMDQDRCYALMGGLLIQTTPKEDVLNFMDSLCLAMPCTRMCKFTEEDRRGEKIFVDMPFYVLYAE